MLATPTSHSIDPASGTLAQHTGRYEKRLADLAGLYADRQAFDTAITTRGDEVVYTVEDVRPAKAEGGLIFGTTHMEPGLIGEEYFMTRGHIHAVADRPETYYGEAGQGLLLMESPQGEIAIQEIAPRVMVYVPPFWIHRSVNTGSVPLVMSFCYPADAGQDYEVIAKTGGMAVRIMKDGDGWKQVPNVSYRPRSAAEAEALMQGAA